MKKLVILAAVPLLLLPSCGKATNGAQRERFADSVRSEALLKELAKLEKRVSSLEGKVASVERDRRTALEEVGTDTNVEKLPDVLNVMTGVWNLPDGSGTITINIPQDKIIFELNNAAISEGELAACYGSKAVLEHKILEKTTMKDADFVKMRCYCARIDKEKLFTFRKTMIGEDLHLIYISEHNRVLPLEYVKPVGE